jgi:PAS domain S-box-containing protein
MRKQALEEEISQKTKSALHKSELQFRRLLEKLPAGAYTCNPEGLITYFNQHAVRLWGRAPKLNDPMDRFCGSFKLFSIDGSPIAHDQCWMALALKMDKEYNGHEIVIERPDGQRFTVLAYANPIHDESGKLIGAVNVLVDISDRRRAEDELEIRVQERTRELVKANEALQSEIAERRRVEKILHESEEHFRLLVAGVKDYAIFMLDTDGYIVSWNAGAELIKGYRAEEIIGKHFSCFYSAEDVERGKPQHGLDIAVREGRYEDEGWRVRKDGSRFWANVLITALQDEKGNLRGFSKVTRDITKRKQAEEELKKSLDQLSKKNRYETIISAVTRSVHRSIDLQDVLENAVEAISENMDSVDSVSIFLVEGQEAVLKANRGFPDWFIERMRRIPYPKGATWKAIIEEKPVYCADVNQDTVIGPIGRELGIKSYLVAPIHFEGKRVGTLNINSFRKNAFDEEEIKLLEIVAQQIEVAISNAQQAERIEESRDFYLKLFDEFPAMIWRSGTDAKCDYLNKSWLEFRGKTIDQEMEDAWAGRIHPDDLESCLKTYLDAFNTRRIFDMEYRLRRYDGEYRWVVDFGRPFYNFEGEFAGYIGSCYDITDRKRMEEERLKFSKLESVGVLAGGIAHDFNNMLTAMLSTISVARMDARFGTNLYNYLVEAEKVCLQARGLTQQLLTFSRGGAPIKKLCSIVETIKDSALFALRGSNVRCEFSIEDDLWDVEADQGQITQAINNLVINAQQAMPQGGVIKIRANNTQLEAGFISSHIKGGKYVKITVEDQGIGIPKEHLARIFDPYFTTKQKGSGLGLATTYSIIKNHEGYIDVESQSTVGTKFYIHIPASEKRAEGKKIVQEKVGGGTKGRVLIMDDEGIIRKSTGKALMRMGYEVECAKDGTEAIEIYTRAREENRAFDLVIMDLTIPGGMGGREAIAKLIETDPEVRAVVSSGYSNDPIMSEYEDYGFRGVVSKPYTIEDLAQTLYKVIGEE